MCLKALPTAPRGHKPLVIDYHVHECRAPSTGLTKIKSMLTVWVPVLFPAHHLFLEETDSIQSSTRPQAVTVQVKVSADKKELYFKEKGEFLN